MRRNGQLEELEELWSSGMYQLSQGEEDEKRKDKVGARHSKLLFILFISVKIDSAC